MVGGHLAEPSPTAPGGVFHLGEVYWCREGNQHCWGLFGCAICAHNQGAESFGSRDSPSAVFSRDSLMFYG